MKKEVKLYLDKEYIAIYSGMNVSWQVGLKNRNEELIYRVLDGSGSSQKILTSFAIGLVKETNDEVEKLLEQIQKKFNFKMSNIEIKEYINKSIVNGTAYIDIFHSDLSNYFEKKGISFSVSSIDIEFNNAKGSIEHNLKRAEERLILINDGEKIKNKLSKSDLIGIIATIITILGIVITIIAIV